VRSGLSNGVTGRVRIVQFNKIHTHVVGCGGATGLWCLDHRPA
jgi:hypothetical protein